MMSARNSKDVGSCVIVNENDVVAARRRLDALNRARYWAGQAYDDTRALHARLVEVMDTLGSATEAFDDAAYALCEAERRHRSTFALQKESARAAARVEQLEAQMAFLPCLQSGGGPPLATS